MSFLPALSLLAVLSAAVDPATTSTAKPVAAKPAGVGAGSPAPARCEPSFVSTAAWTALGAFFGGLVGYTAVSREHGDRPGAYVGIGVALGAAAGLAASHCPEAEKRHDQ